MAPADQRSLETDTVCTLLESPRRRTLLSILVDSETVTAAELARRLAARERNEPLDDVSRDVIERVQISLVHNHLPRLADHDVVEYDRERGAVETTDLVSELEPFLGDFPDAGESDVLLQFSQC